MPFHSESKAFLPPRPSARLCQQEQRAVINWKEHQARGNVCKLLLLWEGSGSTMKQWQLKQEFKARGCMNASGTRMLFYKTSSRASFLKRKAQHRLKPHQKYLGSLGSFLYFSNIQKILIYFIYHSPFSHTSTSVLHGVTLLRYVPHQRGSF